MLAVVVGDRQTSGAALIDRAQCSIRILARAWQFSAWVQISLGEPDRAIEHATRAMLFSPVDRWICSMGGVSRVWSFLQGPPSRGGMLGSDSFAFPTGLFHPPYGCRPQATRCPEISHRRNGAMQRLQGLKLEPAPFQSRGSNPSGVPRTWRNTRKVCAGLGCGRVDAQV